MIAWLEPRTPFPPVEQALTDPDGLLAASADMTPERVIEAYRQGIFPWYDPSQPVLWWSPDPRMVLPVAEFRITRSLRKRLRAASSQPGLRITFNQRFADVMRACAAPRDGQAGTWITPLTVECYTELHRRGIAHSFECWHDSDLVAGGYGLALGRMFFGESMFTRITDGSKMALAALVLRLERAGFPLIDCQQQTRHLASLGARPLARHDFIQVVSGLTAQSGVDFVNPPFETDEFLQWRT